VDCSAAVRVGQRTARLERDRIAADADREWRDATDFAREGIDPVGAAEFRERSRVRSGRSASV
jgi:hypothetical protein